jgi:hypothetical protein
LDWIEPVREQVRDFIEYFSIFLHLPPPAAVPYTSTRFLGSIPSAPPRFFAIKKDPTLLLGSPRSLIAAPTEPQAEAASARPRSHGRSVHRCLLLCPPFSESVLRRCTSLSIESIGRRTQTPWLG